MADTGSMRKQANPGLCASASRVMACIFRIEETDTGRVVGGVERGISTPGRSAAGVWTFAAGEV